MNETQLSARKMRLCYQIEIAGVRYESLSLAAVAAGVWPQTVMNRCRSTKLKWASWKVITVPLKKTHRFDPQRVQVNRKIFGSAAEAAKELKMKRTTVYYRAKRMLEVDGLKYRLLPPSKET